MIPKDDGGDRPRVNTRFASMPAQAFAQLGVEAVAYVRAVDGSGGRAFSIHAADGRPMALAASLELARAFMIQNGLEPAGLH